MSLFYFLFINCEYGKRRIAAGNRVNSALAALVGRTHCSVGTDAVIRQLKWVLQKKNERKINTMEMRSFSRIYGVSLADRTRNEDRQDGSNLETSENVTVRIMKNVISWFGNVERMSDERMAKKIYDVKSER